MLKLNALAGAIAAMAASAPAMALDPVGNDLQAQLSWRLGFGSSHRIETGYGFVAGYRALADAPAAPFFQFDVSDQAALARLFGVPLLSRSYRLDDADPTSSSLPDGSAPAETPWYSESWVWWALGGVALAAGIGGSAGSSGGSSNNCDNCNVNSSNNNDGVLTANGGGGQVTVCVIKGVSPAPGVCQQVPTSPLVGRATFAWSEPLADDDRATGGMGDLVAR